MPHIETMTLNELAESMRQLGLTVNNNALASAIEAGLYPFAICYRSKESNAHRHFEIYRKLFNQWVAERASDGGVA